MTKELLNALGKMEDLLKEAETNLESTDEILKKLNNFEKNRILLVIFKETGKWHGKRSLKSNLLDKIQNTTLYFESQGLPEDRFLIIPEKLSKLLKEKKLIKFVESWGIIPLKVYV